MQVSIREIEKGELLTCLEIIKDSFTLVAQDYNLTGKNSPTHGAFIPLNRLIFERENGFEMFGAFVDNVQVGYYSINKKQSEANLERLCIIKEYRDKGFGTTLLKSAEKEARDCGYKTLAIEIIDEDTGLKKWFKTRGYTETGTRNFPTTPYTVCFMEKKLV